MTTEEKEYVTNFFRYAFFLSPFGYTIFGEKPMSFEVINMTHDSNVVLEEGADYMDIFHIFDRLKLKKCWEVWSKYSHLFPLKRFSMISYEFPLDPDCIEIDLINHDNFLKIVTENIVDFQTVLGSSLTPEQILSKYIKAKGRVFNRIRNHDGLFGTLLGFGRNNSWEFLQQNGKKKMEGSFPFLPNEPKDTKHVLRPAFAVIPNTKETYDLRRSYERQRKQIDFIYQSDDFLEQVLKKLTGA